MEELLQTFVDRALEIVDDLNGTDRCRLIEGTLSGVTTGFGVRSA